MSKNLPFSVLYISNVEETYLFWKNLNFKVIEKTNDKVVIDLNGYELHYVLESTEPFEEYFFATNKNNRGMGSLIYFNTDDINELHSEATKLSPNKITNVKENLWEGREFLFSDPDGYLFVAYKMNE